MKIFHSICVVAATLLLVACGNEKADSQADFVVTIQPIKYIVEQITGDDFRVEVLVPAGASPESFEPTPKQIIELNEAKMVFSTGLITFENSLTQRVENKNGVVNLSSGIELIEGSCSHNHTDNHATEHHSHAHSHGIDPHIWTSPRELKVMARNAYEAIITEWPDSTKYTDAYNDFINRLNELDVKCKELCEASSAKAFVIYHPALTYFSRAYGIEQIAIESDGKEPSAKHIAHIIEEADTKGVKCLLYQTQYPRSTVEIIAKDMNIECREFNPLEEDIISNISSITSYITGK
ncbi:MAG: zinc ABC transporter substrate-binding protein [Alistipes sp.]|nr:zinc ABC transporter substrate-binding protein [Alistipes sp.]